MFTIIKWRTFPKNFADSDAIETRSNMLKQGTVIMPRHTAFSVDEKPLNSKGRVVRIAKAYKGQNYQKPTVLSDDAFTYVSFYYSSHGKSLKYQDATLQARYGSPSKYGYEFYWKQAETFYKASKIMPIEAAPVAAYYCMLNAAKSYLSYTCEFADEFVIDFAQHGLSEDHNDTGEDLSTISIKHKQKGVFPLFAEKMDSDFQTVWPAGTPKSIKSLLYNLPFVHRAYTMTYTTRSKKVDELFLPLNAGDYPKYYKGNDGKAYLVVDMERNAFPAHAQTIPNAILATVSRDFEIYGDKGFRFISKANARWNSNGSISGELKDLTDLLRRDFTYIRSAKRLWYLKKFGVGNSDVLNLNTMVINMAAMHRISEIARYKPEQLNRLMESKENWLLHEFITQSLEQFIDELASQITHQEIMCIGLKV